jgi:hypothetical protein
MDFAAYILSCLAAFAGLAAIAFAALRLTGRLVPGWSGSARWLAVSIAAAGVGASAALLLGSFGLLTGRIYLLLLFLIAAVAWRWAEMIPAAADSPGEDPAPAGEIVPAGKGVRTSVALTAAGLGIASLVVGLFAVEVWQKLGTGMTGFDSTWYHGPFAAGFAASGDTFSLHFLAPQFLSWFYPQNSELFHSLGVLGFGNDLLSPLINLGWLAGCLVAAWAIGRPYGAAPVSLAGVALVLGSAAMADQAGEARNDIVGVFFVLASLAILLNGSSGGRRLASGPLLLVALSAGLAAGTKINFIPAAFVLAAGGVYLAGRARRGRSSLLVLAGLGLGGGYWYLRNLIHSGNPLPWIDGAGPITLPGPDQDLGGRDAASVLGYLGDPGVITDWFFPGLADGFGDGWVLLLGLAVYGLIACLWRGSGPGRRVAALVGLALLLAWAAAPTSASGPAGEPAGFVSGLRYLGPALAVGLALLGAAVGPRGALARNIAMASLLLLAPFVLFAAESRSLVEIAAALVLAGVVFSALVAALWLRRPGRPGERREGQWSRLRIGLSAGLLLLMILAGYGVQHRYFENRYASPEFTTAGLSEAFVWARGVKDESIGTNATRQYPLFGELLENEVQFLGVPGPKGGFVKAESCEQLREAVARGDYRFLVLSLDRESPFQDFPREVQWIEDDPNAREVSRTPPTAVFELDGPLDPETCPR